MNPEFSRDRERDMMLLAHAFFENLERETRCEFGGWGLDDKRPFGNSDVIGDVLEIIGDDVIDYPTEEQKRYALELYDSLGTFLEQKWKSAYPT